MRKLIGAFSACFALFIADASAQTQAYPVKPVRVILEIITLLNTVIVKTANAPEIREAMVKQGLEVRTNTPEEFAAFIRNERAQNAKLVKFAGIKIE